MQDRLWITKLRLSHGDVTGDNDNALVALISSWMYWYDERTAERWQRESKHLLLIWAGL